MVRRLAARAPLVAGVVGLVVGSVMAAGCSDDRSKALDALRGNPVAGARPTDAIDDRVTEAKGSTGALPSPTTLRHTFVLSTADVAGALDELARAATAAGWTVEPLDTSGYRGRKDIGDFEAQLVIEGIAAERTAWIELSTRD